MKYERLRIGSLVFLSALMAMTALAESPSTDAEAAGGPPGADADYRIGVADVLKVVVWGEPQLSLSVAVRPDGKVTVPLVNDVAVAGRTPEEVRGILTEALRAFVRDPNVTVIVEQINSFRVYFLGEVKSQGPLQFYRPVRILQAISSAGGLTEFSKKSITLLREENGQEKRYEIDYKRLLAGDRSQENIHLRPGDTLLVR